MALVELDRKLLQRCLSRDPQAWDAFVERFLGLVLHVARHTCRTRGSTLGPQDEEDLVAEFFAAVVHDDFALLRRFRMESSLATYLAVVARRVMVRELLRRPSAASRTTIGLDSHAADPGATSPEQRLTNREEVERLLNGLTDTEADIVRLYHLEGKTYREISAAIGVPENSIGPTLSRARDKMRRALAESPT